MASNQAAAHVRGLTSGAPPLHELLEAFNAVMQAAESSDLAYESRDEPGSGATPSLSTGLPGSHGCPFCRCEERSDLATPGGGNDAPSGNGIAALGSQ